MLRRIAIGFAVALAWLSSCKTPPVDWPRLVKCETAAVIDNAENIIGAVTRVLLTGGASWASDLESLARTYGADAVACAIESVRRDWSAPGYGATDPRVPVGLERATEFLTSHGVQVQ